MHLLEIKGKVTMLIIFQEAICAVIKPIVSGARFLSLGKLSNLSLPWSLICKMESAILFT